MVIVVVWRVFVRRGGWWGGGEINDMHSMNTFFTITTLFFDTFFHQIFHFTMSTKITDRKQSLREDMIMIMLEVMSEVERSSIKVSLSDNNNDDIRRNIKGGEIIRESEDHRMKQGWKEKDRGKCFFLPWSQTPIHHITMSM